MTGKVALVTGGSSGIGRATALAFATEGARVAIGSRRKSKAEEVVRAIRDRGGDAVWLQADVTDAAQVRTLVDRTVAAFGRLDYAFNNGGSGGRARRTAEMDERDWDATIDGLRAYPFPAGSAYSAAKHGVIGLTKSAALEYVSRGIRINAICPGWVQTPPVERWMRRDPKVARQIIAQEPIGRLGTPEEIAETVIWLCSERATFVVGSAFAIDGGYLA
jgi:NAD(P)-dependent dehydrogenase (short-subunit alcohol dehydrogenase family)